MAEESFAMTSSQEGLSFSQESLPLSQQSLPLSQETYKLLCNEIPQSLHSLETPDLVIGGTVSTADEISTIKVEPEFQSSDFPNAQPSESNDVEICNQEQFGAHSNFQALTLQSRSLIPFVPSSIPASENWPGQYGFTISFLPQPKITKGVSWTYSKVKDKLYVGKDVSCPVNFIVSDGTLLLDVSLRATAMYSSPEHRSDVVYRCMDHSVEEIHRGVVEANHLVRCESKNAEYVVDPITKRHSVVVPFENPPVGQHFSTYIYKFACFGSCNGGPGRRPLMLVFTLERGKEVIGRHKLDVKICACPGRDQRIEENDQTVLGNPVRTKKSRLSEIAIEQSKSVRLLPKNGKKSQNMEGPFTITVDDLASYEFLKQMKKFYIMFRTMKSLPPHVKKYAKQSLKRRNEER